VFCAPRLRNLHRIDAVSPGPPLTGYGEYKWLTLPARGKAIYRLAGGDLDDTEVTITGRHYNTGVAPPEGRAR